jgi:hypothetical protein
MKNVCIQPNQKKKRNRDILEIHHTLLLRMVPVTGSTSNSFSEPARKMVKNISPAESVSLSYALTVETTVPGCLPSSNVADSHW